LQTRRVWLHETVLRARLIFLALDIVLHEAELPFEAIRIDEHTKAIASVGEYRNLNPPGYVPALVLDDGT
jgi:glutathione S-transferase